MPEELSIEVLFAPGDLAARSSIRKSARLERPPGPAARIAPIPIGVSGGMSIRSRRRFPSRFSPSMREIFESNVVQRPVTFSRCRPSITTSVILPGAAASGRMVLIVGGFPRSVPHRKIRTMTSGSARREIPAWLYSKNMAPTF